MDLGRHGAVALRLLVFVTLGYVTLRLLSIVLYPVLGLLIASVLSVFAGASIANALAMRIYEHRRLPDIGLHWNAASTRNLLLGTAGGAGAAMIVVMGPLLAGAARWQAAEGGATGVGSFVFVTLVLLFGAVGEEMLFRGYGFQILVPVLGRLPTVLPMSALFAAAHVDNQGAQWIGIFNTFAWGAVLGWALLRSGGLWLPIGLHFGWNWTLPLLGVNLSGFEMRLTGVSIEWKVADLWSGGAYGPEGGLLCTGVLVVLVWFLVKAPVRVQELVLTGCGDHSPASASASH